MHLPSNFDLRALQVFIVTSEQGGMTQGAKVLGMTQSAVSQIIAGLEESIGSKLFDRTVRPIILTPAGNVLVNKGRKILADSQEAFREASTQDKKQLATITIAMPDSLAHVVGAPLYKTVRNVSSYLRFWAGISPYIREDFLSRKIDVVMTTTAVLEDIKDLERHQIFSEPYVMIFPKSYRGPTELTEVSRDFTLIRTSLRTAMGRRIESQINRLGLKFPETIEFDSPSAPLKAVAAGLGWAITTPLCLLHLPYIMDDLQIVPITRGQFNRHFSLIARENSLGAVPQNLADETRRLLRDECFNELYLKVPWLEGKMAWFDDENLLEDEA